MLLQEIAQALIDSGAPVSPNTVSLRYHFVKERALGLDNQQIADKLNVSLDLIEETEYEIEDEFIN